MRESSGKVFPCPFCEQEHPLSAGFCPDTGRPLLPAHKVAGKTVESYFNVGEMIGEGSTGVVYGCENVTTRILFAAKFFKLNLNDPVSAGAFSRYSKDAREVELTSHRNIAEVAAVGVTPEGIPYEIMEFLRGADLGTLLEQIEKIPLRDAGSLAEQALEGLEAAHSRGIVHGSMKPSSLYLAKQVKGPVLLKILDFGIAHILPHVLRPARPAQTRDVSEKLDYRSPEQIEGGSRKIDHRTDLFSMGAVLFQAITGRHPFPGIRLGASEPPDAREIMPGLAGPIADFLGFSLAAEPGQRFQSALDMLKELRALDLDARAPGMKAGRRKENAEKRSSVLGLSPVREVVTRTHKDYSLSRRERIIRLDRKPDRKEDDGSDTAGNEGSGK